MLISAPALHLQPDYIENSVSYLKRKNSRMLAANLKNSPYDQPPRRRKKGKKGKKGKKAKQLVNTESMFREYLCEVHINLKHSLKQKEKTRTQANMHLLQTPNKFSMENI